MKFITRTLAVLFVFAIFASACTPTVPQDVLNHVPNAWHYEENVDELTGEITTVAQGRSIAQYDILLMHVGCDAPKVTVVTSFPGATRYYIRGNFFDVTARFDDKPAFDMRWQSAGSELSYNSKWISYFIFDPDSATHGEKFLQGLRTSSHLRFRPEQQSDIFAMSLSGARNSIGRVLRDCGRDDLIE